MTFHALDLHNDSTLIFRCPRDATGCRVGKKHTKINSYEQGSFHPTAYMEFHFLIIFSPNAKLLSLLPHVINGVALIFLPLKTVMPFICGPRTIA